MSRKMNEIRSYQKELCHLGEYNLLQIHGQIYSDLYAFLILFHLVFV